MMKLNIKKILPKRSKDSHKGTYGKILNIAGSKRYTGAALLSSVSALKVGAGYVTLASSEYVCSTIASQVPDITFLPLNNLDDLQENITNYNIVSIGCGLSQSEDAVKIFSSVLKIAQNDNIPTVIDADGVNILAKMDIETLGKNFVITPHPMELANLLKLNVEEIQSNRKKMVNLAADKFDCTVVLKGYKTLVSDGVSVYQNKTGNSALAKAGTGDVLCGMIAGFMAQGCNQFDSAVLGVCLHGLCADKYAKEFSQYSMLASDLLNYIPKILKRF